ncbi:peptidoglycan-binding domain-containing protein, partial [Azospirillum argentinense]|uniref:peptidoglycan-binding domain-containing protein n=1 Tax=Azospirillum argentinense TaxID=2970906 RepID=UPI001FFF01FB
MCIRASSYSLTAPPDAPAAVRMALEEAGFAGFAALANPAPATVRHSGTQLLYQRSGTLTVVALSWECDGVLFEVETVGSDGDSAPLPPFLDTVLAPVLARIAALPPADAFALAGAYRLTRSVAEAVLDGREPDAAAIVADHEGCVSPAFVKDIAAVLAERFAETSRTAVARSWIAAAGLLALVLLLVAGVDGPALLTGATPEQPAPAALRLGWDIGLPIMAGLGLWVLVRGVVRGALGAAFGGTVRAPDQGSWPLVLLSAAAALHLGLLTWWNGGPGFSRLNHRLDVEAITEGRAPMPTPRVLTPEERIMAAQRALARLGRYDGAIDGKMGEGTRTGLASLTGLIDTPPGVAPEDPLDLAVAIAADRVAVNVRTPELLVGPGWSNATRLRMNQDDQPQVAGAFLGALAASGTERASVGQEWMSGDRLRSGVVTVTGRIADPKDRGRLCFGLTHVVTTPAGRDAGTPLRTCRTAGNWTLEE